MDQNEQCFQRTSRAKPSGCFQNETTTGSKANVRESQQFMFQIRNNFTSPYYSHLIPSFYIIILPQIVVRGQFSKETMEFVRILYPKSTIILSLFFALTVYIFFAHVYCKP